MWLQYVAWHPVLRHTPEMHAFVFAECGTSETGGKTRADLSTEFAANVLAFTEAAGTTDAISAAAALSALDSELRSMDRPLLISQRLMQTKRSLDAIDRALSSA